MSTCSHCNEPILETDMVVVMLIGSGAGTKYHERCFKRPFEGLPTSSESPWTESPWTVTRFDVDGNKIK